MYCQNSLYLLDGEVEAVKFLTVEEFKKWINGEGEKMVSHSEEYSKLIEFLEK